MIKKINSYFIFLLALQTTHAETTKTLLILDTSGASQASYTQLKALANSTGFSTQFANFYTPPDSLESFDAVLFFVTAPFLQEVITSTDNPLTSRVIALVKNFVKNQNHLLAILFPGRLPQTPNNHTALCTFFSALEIDPTVCTTMQNLAPCIFSSDEQRSSTYRTSLYPVGLPAQKKKSIRCSVSSIGKTKQTPVTLPIGNPQDYLGSLFPLGVYLHPLNSAGIFLGADSSFAGAELEENMFFTPYYWKDKQVFFKGLQQTLWQLQFTINKQAIPTQPNNNLTLPAEVIPLTQMTKKSQFHTVFSNTLLDQLNENSIRCAWMEIEPLKDNIKKAATYIYQSRINLLWFSFNPEWYLSTKATRDSTLFKKIEQNIGEFTQALTQTFAENKAPAIFAGFDLTNNFSKVTVTNPVMDVYGKVYSKIPSPFDEAELWQEEFIKPLDLFLDRWRVVTNNKMPLAGIFFDLEMYHAPQETAVYTNTMDFSTIAWKIYVTAKKQPQLFELQNVKSRVTFLTKNNLFEEYFEILEQEAHHLGTLLRKEIKTKLPQGLIGVYLPSLLDCWFYRGLLAGLSTKEEPIILATFNTNYYGHSEWLEKHSIYALHLPVIMLSHITSDEENIELKKLHDGVWINRFSRLFEPCTDNQWYRLECTKERHSLVIDHIKSYTAKN